MSGHRPARSGRRSPEIPLQSEFPDLTVFRLGIPHQLIFPVAEDAAEYPHYAAVA